MKRILLIGILVSIPALLFLNVWQGFRYWELERGIARLQDEQQQMFEENKLMIVNIAVAASPARIAELAQELGLEKYDAAQRLIVRLSRRGSDG